MSIGDGPVDVVLMGRAYEDLAECEQRAQKYFEEHNRSCRFVPLLTRSDALREDTANQVAHAEFLYFAGGSPLHLRSCLTDTPAWKAVIKAHASGATVLFASGSAMAVGDPMVDPRGGAPTLGLGMIRGIACIPHWEIWHPEILQRTLELVSADTTVLGLPSLAGVRVTSSGKVDAIGDEEPICFRNREQIALRDVLARFA